MDKSRLMATYNSARVMVSEGVLDAGRLNRGFGLAQRKDTAPKYITTAEHCSCPDSTYRSARGVVCKHRIALVMKEA